MKRTPPVILAAILGFGMLPPNSLAIAVLRSDLGLQEEGTAIRGAKLLVDNTTQINVRDITFCIRFNFALLGGWEGRSHLIHIEDWRESPGDSQFRLLTLGAMHPLSFFSFGHPREKGSYKSYLLKDPDNGEYEIWSTYKWSSVCFSYGSKDGFVQFVKDGKTLTVNFSDPELTNVNIPPDFLSKVYIGRCSFNYTNACSMAGGQISDFNVWSRALSEGEAQDWTTCRDDNLKGDLVDWNTARFELFRLGKEEAEFSSLCLPSRPGRVVIPSRASFGSSASVCRRLGGRMAAVEEAEEQEVFSAQVRAFPECVDKHDSAVGRYWSGWSDEDEEGVFRSVANNSVVLTKTSFQNWQIAEPNGDTMENCVMIQAGTGLWYDVKCSAAECSLCQLEEVPRLRVRGLCEGSRFDTKYTWVGRESGGGGGKGPFSFRGYSGTVIEQDAVSNHWVMRLYGDNYNINATTEGQQFPFGIRKWRMNGEGGCSGGSENGTAAEVILSLSTCSGEEEFTCDDGNCVRMDYRCDGTPDCPDRSDEYQCEIVRVEASYSKDVPPPPKRGEKRSIAVAAIKVLSVLGIEEVRDVIAVQLQLDLTWNDSRVVFNDLKQDRNLNVLNREARDTIWIPTVVFNNTRSKSSTEDDDKALATVALMGEFRRSPNSEAVSSRRFSGSDNPLTISRVYDLEFLCRFDMSTYPFGEQRCSMVLVMRGNQGRFVELVASGIEYQGPVDLTQYFIKSVFVAPNKEKSGIVAEIFFGRRLLGTVLTTYLPSVLLSAVCFSTNHFKFYYFEAAVTVNLTSLLVLTTLFVGTFNSLPSTSYLKVVDIWLVANLFIPFAEVLLHTLAEGYRDEDHAGNNAERGGGNENTGVLELSPPGTGGSKRRSLELVDVNGHFNGVSSAREEQAQRKRRRAARRRAVQVAAGAGLPAVYAAFVLVYFMASAIAARGK